MKIAFVTTFNKKLYYYYAHRFMCTYNWPFDLYVYHEGWTPEISPKNNNIFFRDIYGTNPELSEFIERNKERNVSEGNFRKDAIRFSYKIFAKTHLMLDCDYDYVFWIDADTVFKKTITKEEVVKNFLPEDQCISFIDRPGKGFSECGFVGYNLRMEATKNFVYKLREHYTKDLVFQEKEWHDSWVWDSVRKKNLQGHPQYNLAPKIAKQGNPWPDTPMSEYADHLKGKKRKDTGVM